MKIILQIITHRVPEFGYDMYCSLNSSRVLEVFFLFLLVIRLHALNSHDISYLKRKVMNKKNIILKKNVMLLMG